MSITDCIGGLVASPSCDVADRGQLVVSSVGHPGEEEASSSVDIPRMRKEVVVVGIGPITEGAKSRLVAVQSAVVSINKHVKLRRKRNRRPRQSITEKG